MLNQLKSDVYRLLNQRLAIAVLWSLLGLYALFLVMSLTHTALSMGAWIGESDGEPVAVGFMGFAYADNNDPRFWEIAYSSTSFGGLVWIVFLILSTLFVSSEFTSGTIKLSVAYGIGVFRTFVSKWIVVAAATSLISVVFGAVAFVTSCVLAGYSPSGSQIAGWAGLLGLQTLIMIVLTLICFTLFVLTKSIVGVMGIIPTFMFAAVFLYATTAEDRPLPAQIFMDINPMYYLTEASRYWVDSDIVVSVLLYVVIGVPAMLALSWAVLTRRELQ